MTPRHPQTPVLDPPSPALCGLPVERLYRVGPGLYRSLVERGLIVGDEVRLGDGLLYRGGELYRMPLGVYERVAELGLLGPEDGTEFLDGLLVRKMTKGNAHVVATLKAMKALERVVSAGWVVLKEDPVVLPSGPSGQASEPEPDVAVVLGELDDLLTRRPGPGDVGLVVEVAESSLRDDRGKLARYAWARIPQAWVIDLAGRSVEVYKAPSGPVEVESEPTGYREVKVYRPGERIPVVLGGVEAGTVAVNDLLPRATG